MGFVDKWPSRMQGQWSFEVGRTTDGHEFSVGPKIMGFLSGGLPLPKSTFPLELVEGCYLTVLSDAWQSGPPWILITLSYETLVKWHPVSSRQHFQCWDQINLSVLHVAVCRNQQCICMFDKAFASFSLLTRKNLHKNKCTTIDTHILEVDTYYDLWRKNTHVDWHTRNWNDTYY